MRTRVFFFPRRAFHSCKMYSTTTVYGSLVDVTEDAADMYAYVLDQYVHDRNVSLNVLERAIELDPQCVNPKCVLGMLDESKTKEMVRNVNSITRSSQEERQYAQALNAFSKERLSEAAEILDEMLLKHPSDLVALKLASDILFRQGEHRNRRCLVPRVLDLRARRLDRVHALGPLRCPRVHRL